MLFGLFWGDWTFLVLIPAMIFTVIAQIKVKSTFDKYDKIKSVKGITGAEAARKILDQNQLYHIKVERTRGYLSDHYDPRNNVIRLSDSTYDSTGIAAIGVAAHEAGHAVQHATDYLPTRVRSAIIPITQIGSRMAMPIFLVGLLISSFALTDTNVGGTVMLVGIILFSLTVVFQLITLPTEFNASARALATLEKSEMLYSEEISGARSVLRAAAMTYVAALAASFASLLRLLLIAARASRTRR